MPKNKKSIILALDNIRSVHNVGSCFRIADSLGIPDVFLGGITPTPLDRFGRPRKDMAKVALGGELSVSWQAGDIVDFVRQHKASHYIIALEQHSRSVDYKDVIIPDKPVIFILGGEVEGVDPSLLELSDTIISIPQSGIKESLNVSVAGAIALYRLFDR